MKYSCYRKQKSLELIAKRIKLTVERTIENIRKNDQTNVYIRTLGKQKGLLQNYIFMRSLKVLYTIIKFPPSIELYQPASMKKKL